MQWKPCRAVVLSVSLGLLAAALSSAAVAQYQLTNLSSDNGNAEFLDRQLVNPWGLAFAPGGGGYPGGPFWINDEGSGWATSELGSGQAGVPRLVIPAAKGNGTGVPTGVVLNATQQFHVRGFYSIYLVATLDGAIDAWVPQINYDGVQTVINNSGSNASYTGLAVTQYAPPTPNFLFAVNQTSKEVEIYDGNFHYVKSFTDSGLRGMVPYGIQDINGQVYVAFANASGVGVSSGIIDVFNEDGTFVKHLVSDLHLKHPWGLAVAPANFGPLSNALLISNNTSAGTLNGFDLTTGSFLGTVEDSNGHPIVIDGLLGIKFGGGSPKNGETNQLFFTAGPHQGANGLFGMIAFQ